MATAAALLADDDEDQQILISHLKQAASKNQDRKQAARFALRFEEECQADVEKAEDMIQRASEQMLQETTALGALAQQLERARQKLQKRAGAQKQKLTQDAANTLQELTTAQQRIADIQKKIQLKSSSLRRMQQQAQQTLQHQLRAAEQAVLASCSSNRDPDQDVEQ